MLKARKGFAVNPGEESPQMRQTLDVLCMAYAKLERWAESEEAARSALRAQGNRFQKMQANAVLGEAMTKQGRAAEARDLLARVWEQVSSEEPPPEPVLVNLANATSRAHRALGDDEASDAVIDRAKELIGDHERLDD